MFLDDYCLSPEAEQRFLGQGGASVNVERFVTRFYDESVEAFTQRVQLMSRCAQMF